MNSSHKLCIRCGYGNPDLILPSCHCALHARCTPVPIRSCPNPQHCHIPLSPGCPLELLPMDFGELDDARRSHKPAKKKAKMNVDEEAPAPSDSTCPISNELRTGRWTAEETSHCDNLIHHFMTGHLPLTEGMKLNEFLANMLKSKQSRLTKKMKNAKLSSKTFKRSMGYLSQESDAKAFSIAEMAFFHSIPNALERCQMKFHVGKEWRELFSTYCVSHGQALNVDTWLASVEEMDRRNLRQKEMERVRRREMMMGCALRQDLLNPDRGVLIDGVKSGGCGDGPAGTAGNHGGGAAANVVSSLDSSHDATATAYASQGYMESNLSTNTITATGTTSNMMYQNISTQQDPFAAHTSPQENTLSTSPFLQNIITYIQKHHVPFEYVDVWVPSFVPDESKDNNTISSSNEPKCRLCFAGSSISKQVILENNNPSSSNNNSNRRTAVPLSPEDQFNLSSFGDYSESFSFDVGCGLPGRVYHMGVPTWEQSVHNAPLHHFERVGGAQQWGIRTVVGIPVPSPNVGRVVVVLYSRYDRAKDHDLVIRLTEEFSRLMPSPKWKLVVDVGEAPVVQQQQQQQQQQSNGAHTNGGTSAPNGQDSNTLTAEVISMFGEHMPSDPSNPGFAYLQGFMSLRLLLLRPTRTNQEQDIVDTILSSYSSYKAGGRTRPDMALMLARDFMFLNQQNPVVGMSGQHTNGVQVQQQQQCLPMNENRMHHHGGMHQQGVGGRNAPAPAYDQAVGGMNAPAHVFDQAVGSMNAPAPVYDQAIGSMNAPAPVTHHQAPQSSESAGSYASATAPSQAPPSYQMPQDQYLMMGDIEPAPVNALQQQDVHFDHHQQQYVHQEVVRQQQQQQQQQVEQQQQVIPQQQEDQQQVIPHPQASTHISQQQHQEEHQASNESVSEEPRSQSALDAAVENVERLLSPENSG